MQADELIRSPGLIKLAELGAVKPSSHDWVAIGHDVRLTSPALTPTLAKAASMHKVARMVWDIEGCNSAHPRPANL
ncbi:MAG: hypothetical protein R3F44_01450 [Candidatus Competibacteraceae bacterium]